MIGRGVVNLSDRRVREYVHELGDTLAPAGGELGGRIVEGKAGKVPAWGYKILGTGPERALEVLVPHVMEEDAAVRKRVVLALGYMGEAARPAKGAVDKAMGETGDAGERGVLGWCLTQMEGEGE